jgi:NADPH2:quinone reductase
MRHEGRRIQSRCDRCGGCVDRFQTAKPAPKGRDIPGRRQGDLGHPVDYKVRKRAARRRVKQNLGYDAAGVVDAVGPDVTLLKPGDEVFTPARSSARAPARNSIWSTSAPSAKPKTLSFAQSRRAAADLDHTAWVLFDRLGAVPGKASIRARF